MNKFMKKIAGMFTPKKYDKTTTTTTATITTNLFDALKKNPNCSHTFPRLKINDPKTKCKGTKKGANHYVRPAGEGLSS